MDCERSSGRSLPVHVGYSFCVGMKGFAVGDVCIYGEAFLYAT